MQKLLTIPLLLLLFITAGTACDRLGTSGGTPDRLPENAVEYRSVYFSHTDTTKLDFPDSVWKKVLPDSVYEVARKGETERPFTGKYWNAAGLGAYYCAACGNALFRSDAKFASTCGWPSFFETLRKYAALYRPDTAYGMDRTEVLCGRCGAHLGHLFNDGPPPSGKRYCMNSVVLDFVPDSAVKPE